MIDNSLQIYKQERYFFFLQLKMTKEIKRAIKKINYHEY